MTSQPEPPAGAHEHQSTPPQAGAVTGGTAGTDGQVSPGPTATASAVEPVSLVKRGEQSVQPASEPPVPPLTPTVGAAIRSHRARAASAMSGFGPGQLLALAGAVLTFLAAFLTWATSDARSTVGSIAGGGTIRRSGLQGGHLGTATLVLSLLAMALVALLARPALRRWGWIAVATAGALTALLAVLDAIASSDKGDLNRQVQAICAPRRVVCTTHVSTGPGVWLTLLGALAILTGAILHHRERRGPGPASPPDAGAPVEERVVTPAEPQAVPPAEPEAVTSTEPQAATPTEPVAPTEPQAVAPTEPVPSTEHQAARPTEPETLLPDPAAPGRESDAAAGTPVKPSPT